MSIPLSSLQFSFKDTLGGHQVLAHQDDTPIGKLEWAAGTGKIHEVFVAKQHRRKGVATALLKHSRKIAQDKGLKVPTHSERRSNAGDNWAQSLGEQLPERKSDRESRV
jgi:GNAT superfamily N-acetyltransferase